MNYLIDTCIVSGFFKKNPSILNRFRAISPSQIYISTITAMEIEYGLNLHAERKIKIKHQWEKLLEYIQIIDFSYACAVSSAMIRSQLKSSGLPIGPFDILIAGTAVANNMIMVTSNLKEFTRVDGMIIENWEESNVQIQSTNGQRH